MESRDDALAADRRDPLRSFRDEFDLPAGVIYLDGNSLGPPSRRVLEALRAVQDEWATALVTGWDRWVDLPRTAGDALGAALLGAAEGRVLVADTTTLNLYKTIATALTVDPSRTAIMIAAGEFPTDRYIAQRLSNDVREVAVDDFATALDDGVAVVVVSAVDYRTAELRDIAAITEVAHAAGARVVWDLSHAVGSVPVRLDEWEVDFAVGCTYKYVNAGPGAPAFLYVCPELQHVAQPVPGWFGHADRFAMEASYRPADGIERFLTGTPNIPGTVAVTAGVALLRDAGIDSLYAKSTALTALAIGRADALLAPLGYEIATPRDAARRGAHVALRHPAAASVCAALHRAGVVTDHRRPDVIRLAFAPLYTRFVDVWDTLAILEQLGSHPT